MSLKRLRNRLLQQRHYRAAVKRLRALEMQLPAPHTRLAVPFLFRAHGFYKSIRPMQACAALVWDLKESITKDSPINTRAAVIA